MTGMEFDPAELEEEEGAKPEEGEGEDDGDKKPSFSDFHVPDDYEDEELRGLSGAELLSTLKQSRELTKRAIEQANSASGAANAAANAANAAASASRPASAPAAPTELTKEDLLLGDPKVVNEKIAAIFAEKARPVLVEQYTKMTHQAIELARRDTERMPYWSDYETEILNEARNLSLDVTSNMATWTHLYSTVTGRHQKEIIEKEIAKRTEKGDDETDLPPTATAAPISADLVGRRVTVGATGERGKGGGGGGKKGAPKLNDEQRRAAHLLGVAEEDYARYLPEEE